MAILDTVMAAAVLPARGAAATGLSHVTVIVIGLPFSSLAGIVLTPELASALLGGVARADGSAAASLLAQFCCRSPCRPPEPGHRNPADSLPPRRVRVLIA